MCKVHQYRIWICWQLTFFIESILLYSHHIHPCLYEIQLKERREKLENWRMKEKMKEEKKTEKNEVLRRQSSTWIDESELEKRILEVVVYPTPLWVIPVKNLLFALMPSWYCGTFDIYIYIYASSLILILYICMGYI